MVISLALALGAAGYAFTSLTGNDNALGFLRLIDVGSEQSITTYLSAVNLLLASLLLLLLFAIRRQQQAADALCWGLLAPVFLLLSIDESISVHENFDNVYHFFLGKGWIPPMLSSHEWVPFGVLFVVVFGVVIGPMLRHVNRQTLGYMVLAGTIFVSGALGLELLGAVMLETGFVASKTDSIYLTRRILEEGFEMYGIALFNWAIYREIQRRPATVQIGDLRRSDPDLSSTATNWLIPAK